MAAAKGLGLTFRPCEAVVISDAGYLRRILQNLIGNAVRYTDRGRILVAARQRGRMLRLEVWDTGPGIPEDEGPTPTPEPEPGAAGSPVPSAPAGPVRQDLHQIPCAGVRLV